MVTCGAAGTTLGVPYIISRYIDAARAGATANSLVAIALVFAAFALLEPLLRMLETRLATNLAVRGTNRLRAELFEHCLRLDPSFHESHSPGEMIERIDGDVGLLSQFFSSFLVQVATSGLLLVGMVVILLVIDWRVGGIIAVFALAATATLMLLQRVGEQFWKNQRRLSAEQFGRLEEFLGSTEDIRANGATAYAENSYLRAADATYRAALKAQLISGGGYNFGIFLFASGTAAAMAVAAFLFTNGAVTLGTVYLIFSYANSLSTPLSQLTQHIGYLQSVGAAVARVGELLAMTSSITEPAKPEAMTTRPPAVNFSDVDFGYGEGENVLHGITFEIPAGKALGVVGRTGSGKTTLGRLLVRLGDPRVGSVELAGTALNRISLDDLRRSICAVSQDVQIFRGSVRDNVTMFDASMDDDAVIEAVELAGMGDWLSAQPQGLDYLLSPGGRDLSAGQAQLLALARAFLRDPAVVVLDEASSRLDPATEARLEGSVASLLRGRTAMVIAHRLETLDRVDLILVMDAGRVAEFGAPADLLADPKSRFSQLRGKGLTEVLA
jgi:ATP-binding cassette, subfamily B, bacterial